jgi:hypothetical protein
METYSLVYTKDGSNNNIIPLTYNLLTDTISFNIKDLSGTSSGTSGATEFANLSSTIQTVTQLTSITTSVRLNQPYGKIELFSPFNLTGNVATFTFNNSFINSNSIIINHIFSRPNGSPPMYSNIRYVSDGVGKVDIFYPLSGGNPSNITGIIIYYRIYTENTPTINV